MNIKIVCAGHSLKSYERAWMDEYEKRSKRFARIEIARVKEKSPPISTWKEMTKAIPKNSYTLLLDPKGKLHTTSEFSHLFSKAEKSFKGNISFVVGGSYGLPDEAKNEADELISLTPLTLPHRIALLVLLEQVYRVLTLRAGTPYHH